MHAQDPRTAQPAGNNSDIMLMADNPEHILRNSTNPWFRTVYINTGRTRHSKQDDLETLAHGQESEDEGSSSILVQGHDPTSSPPKPILDLLKNAELRETRRQMAHRKGARMNSSRVKETVSQAAKATRSDAFKISYECANDDLKITPFHFVKQILMETT